MSKKSPIIIFKRSSLDFLKQTNNFLSLILKTKNKLIRNSKIFWEIKKQLSAFSCNKLPKKLSLSNKITLKKSLPGLEKDLQVKYLQLTIEIIH